MGQKVRRGDSVWVESRVDAGKQGNGIVIRIDYDSEDVVVKFHDNVTDNFDMGLFSEYHDGFKSWMLWDL